MTKEVMNHRLSHDRDREEPLRKKENVMSTKMDKYFKEFKDKRQGVQNIDANLPKTDGISEQELMMMQAEGRAKYNLSDTRGKIEKMVSMATKPNAKNIPLDMEHKTLSAYENLMKEGEPFVTFAVGTTGLLKDDEVMQITLQAFEKAENGYAKTDSRILLVRAKDEIIERALKMRDRYDIFKQGGFGSSVKEGGLGITEAEYRNPDNPKVHSVEDTVERVMAFVKEHEDAAFIGINPEKMVPYLERMGITMPKTMDIQDIYKEYDHREYESGREEYLNTSGGNYTFVNMCKDALGVEEDMVRSTYHKSGYEKDIMDAIFEKEKERTADKESVKEESSVSKEEKPVEESKKGEEVKSIGFIPKASEKQVEKAESVRKDAEELIEMNESFWEIHKDDDKDMLLDTLLAHQRQTEMLLEKIVSSVTTIVELSRDIKEGIKEISPKNEKGHTVTFEEEKMEKDGTYDKDMDDNDSLDER